MAWCDIAGVVLGSLREQCGVGFDDEGHGRHIYGKSEGGLGVVPPLEARVLENKRIRDLFEAVDLFIVSLL